MPFHKMLGTGTASIFECKSILFQHNQGMLVPGNGTFVRGKGVLVITSKGTSNGECLCYMKDCLLQSKVSSGGTLTIRMPYTGECLCHAMECSSQIKKSSCNIKGITCAMLRSASHTLSNHSYRRKLPLARQ